jgi:glutamyl endopeptidase
MDTKEFVLEKLKINRAREKFWIGGVALVLATSVINWQIQHKEIELKQIEEENKHLSQFVSNILDKDPLTRLYIAEYFKNLSYSSEARSRWHTYETVAASRVIEEKEAYRKRVELEVRMGEILDELSDPKTPHDRRKELQTEILTAKIDIDEVRRKLQALNPTLKAPSEDTRVQGTDGHISGIKGTDDRIRVLETTKFPWSAICSLNLTDKTGSSFIATGFAVSRYLVITTGYAVANLRSPSDINVVCGQDEAVAPFGVQSGKVILVSPFQDELFDYPEIGGIVLSEPLSKQVGKLTLQSVNEEAVQGLLVTVAGYPGGSRSGQQWRDIGPILGVSSNSIRHVLDTSAGVGGAPVLAILDDGYKVIGIHTAVTRTDSVGVRIRPIVIDLINDWIEQAQKNATLTSQQ